MQSDTSTQLRSEWHRTTSTFHSAGSTHPQTEAPHSPIGGITRAGSIATYSIRHAGLSSVGPFQLGGYVLVEGEQAAQVLLGRQSRSRRLGWSLIRLDGG